MSVSNAYGPFHGARLQEFAEIARDPDRLTEAQSDGRACIFCGGEDGAMAPVGIIRGAQVFGHEACDVR